MKDKISEARDIIAGLIERKVIISPFALTRVQSLLEQALADMEQETWLDCDGQETFPAV